MGDVEPIMSFFGFSLQYHSQDSGASSGRQGLCVGGVWMLVDNYSKHMHMVCT